jgi:propionyl-CoA synthetase
MFSAPTAVRVLKKQDPAALSRHDLSSLRALFLAGEPLDEPTAKWIAEALGKPIIDNYWQTETGWPILTICNGVETAPSKFGSPGQGRLRLRRQAARREHRRRAEGRQPEGRGRHRRAAAAGLHADRMARRRALRQDLLESVPGRQVYSTFDWGIRDRTATSSSSAAPTTSSTSPATGWARARSRRASPATPTWPRWPWSAWPTSSRGRWRWPLPC